MATPKFTTDVADAVACAASPGHLLVVWIADDSSASMAIQDVFEDPKVTQHLDDRVVCLRLATNSDGAHMFGQIYTISKTPVVYIIKEGMPLHRLEEVLDPDDFAEKLCASKDTVPGSQRRDFSTTPNPPSLAEPTSPSPLGGNEPQLPSVPLARPAATPDTAPSSPPQATVTTAATASSTRRSPIIATPVEGAIVSSPEDASASPTTTEPAVEADPEEPTPSPAPRTLPTPPTQLLVRLLDGSVLRTRFDATETTLGDVDDYIREHRTDGTAPYYLIQLYPRRQYTSEQYSCTLAELDLCPSGTLVLKPAPESTVLRSLLNPVVGNTAHANTVAERSVLFFAWCFSYTQLIGAFVCGLFRRLFGTTTSPSDDRNDSPASETATSTARRPTVRHGPRVRTVHSAPDSDSERDTTYNGNSTNMRP